ncbi:hypothetical protein ACSSS7_002259 [Eimeria intestinalis]
MYESEEAACDFSAAQPPASHVPTIANSCTAPGETRSATVPALRAEKQQTIQESLGSPTVAPETAALPQLYTEDGSKQQQRTIHIRQFPLERQDSQVVTTTLQINDDEDLCHNDAH